uniref:Uncharacterized protein n=1 Tax=Pararge aegeria TaxID=116150 RepID=S4NK17_9NEOP
MCKAVCVFSCSFIRGRSRIPVSTINQIKIIQGKAKLTLLRLRAKWLLTSDTSQDMLTFVACIDWFGRSLSFKIGFILNFIMRFPRP